MISINDTIDSAGISVQTVYNFMLRQIVNDSICAQKTK